MQRNKAVTGRYESPDANPFCDSEIHVMRPGNIAFAIHAFELFLDFGMRIKARSRAQVLVERTVEAINSNWEK